MACSSSTLNALLSTQIPFLTPHLSLSFLLSLCLLISPLLSEKVLITVITVFLSVGATSAHSTLFTA